MDYPNVTKLGVLSDTHGLLRSEVTKALEGVELIFHAGDVGRMQILGELERIAPVVAVRGNVDAGPQWRDLPLTQTLQVSGFWFHILHDLNDLNFDVKGAAYDVVVSGHSHQPKIESRQGILFLNPGSAGPRRFKLPITLARFDFKKDSFHPRIVQLAIEGSAA